MYGRPYPRKADAARLDGQAMTPSPLVVANQAVGRRVGSLVQQNRGMKRQLIALRGQVASRRKEAQKFHFALKRIERLKKKLHQEELFRKWLIREITPKTPVKRRQGRLASANNIYLFTQPEPQFLQKQG